VEAFQTSVMLPVAMFEAANPDGTVGGWVSAKVVTLSAEETAETLAGVALSNAAT
jgi:hypothetical protein